MALLTVKASKKVDATLRLEESTAKLIDRYAAFLKVPADEVVDKGMEYIFTKDKDFQQHLEKEPDIQVPASLRIKKTPGTPGTTRNGTRNGSKSVASDAK
jgi:hypothetical protein